MALVNAYASVADVQEQLGDGSAKLDSVLIERAVSSASRAVDKYCGRRFWQDPAPVVRKYRAFCPDVLDVADISTQTGLVVEVDRHNTGTWETLGASTYHLEPLNADADGGSFAWYTIVIDSGDGFPVFDRTPLVRVTARWGWATIPDAVIEATILRSVSLFKRKDAPLGVVSGFADFGPVRISRSDPDYAALLGPYRRMVVA